MATVGMGGKASVVCDVASSKMGALFNSSSGCMRVQKITPSHKTDPLDTTSIGNSGVRTFTTGLKELDFTVEGIYPRAAPSIGTFALTMTGGPTFRPSFVDVNISFGTPVDITTGSDAAAGYKVFAMPQECSWTADVECLFDSSAAILGPDAPNSVGTACTIKLAEGGANDPTLTGTALIVAVDSPVEQAGKIMLRVKLQGTSTLTFAAGSGNYASPLPAGAMSSGQSDWDTDGDGTPDITTVVTLDTSRTITGPMSLTSLRIRTDPRVSIAMTAGIKCMGAPSFA